MRSRTAWAARRNRPSSAAPSSSDLPKNVRHDGQRGQHSPPDREQHARDRDLAVPGRADRTRRRSRSGAGARPRSMNSAPLVKPWPITYAATPARPCALSNPNRTRTCPTWLIVEKASSRLRWRCAKHITAAPQRRHRRPARSGSPAARRRGEPAARRRSSSTRARCAYSPSSTITPENSTHTGVGATAWASASQKCTGTAAALVRNPMNSSTIATITSASARMAVQRGTDLGHVERAGARVQHRDAGEDRVGAHAVGDREVDRALHRPALFDLVRG